MKNYYHCFQCKKIPLIEINNNKISVTCPKDFNIKKEMIIKNYCESYIKNCNCCNSSIYFNDNQFLCKNCLTIF